MNAPAQPVDECVPLGYIAGVHGVQGWVKVYSYTRPAEAILDYPVWRLGPQREPLAVQATRRQGKALVASLAGVTDRTLAHERVGQEIAVRRQDMPPPEQGQYYWSDLEGLQVVNVEGVSLGRVARLMETGANDVLVVQNGRERLIPWLKGQVVKSVELDSGRLVVDWDPED